MKLSGRNLQRNLRGDDVHLLHTELTGISADVPEAEMAKAFFGAGTDEAVRTFQSQHGLEPSGVVDEKTAAVINEEFDKLHGDQGGDNHGGGDQGGDHHDNGGGQPTEDGEDPWQVRGTVAAAARGSVPGLVVTVLDRSIRHDDELGKTVTDSQGRYAVSYPPASFRVRGKQAPDVVAVVTDPNGVRLAHSDVVFDAGPLVTIDVLIPEGTLKGLVTEHEALAAAVAGHFDGALSDLREDDDHQDLTYLSRKTGWDARAIALAATAAQLSTAASQAPTSLAAEAPALTPDHYYALLRSGAADSADAVHALHPADVSQIWDRAIEAGVVPETTVGENRDQAMSGFSQMAAYSSLQASPALPGASSLSALLRQSLGQDEEQHQVFAELLVTHRDDPDGLWTAARERLGGEAADRLRVDGQLALVTLDNAALIERLHAQDQGPLASATDLAARGFGDAEAWAPLIDADAIPDTVPGEDADTRRQRYADLLAAQVRAAFPTAVTAHQVGTGALVLADPGQSDAVSGFLSDHAADFQIGAEPVSRYLARTGTDAEAPVLSEVQRIQRVYQLTQDDRTMAALLDRGLDSAHAIVDAGPQLLRSTLGQFSEAQVDAIRAKALQVHLAVLNLAGTYLTARQAPMIGGGPAATLVDPSSTTSAPAAAAGPVEPPDLEQLFGSMDLCTCTECRSVLSPAAYLVDLLQFTARPASQGSVPQDVLFGRRPDLQHLPLSCENTNTPLPYIDVVNETLECFVTSGLSLAGYTGHDTDEHDRPEDLLASPKFVQDAAYTLLAGEHFPPPLPFHRPLELLRRHVSALVSPGEPDRAGHALADLLQAVRADDAVERAGDAGYGWRDVEMERIGISRAEHDLLTDSTISLAGLYGFPAGTADADVVTAMSDPTAFARRLGLTYDEVAQLVQTRFVNPAAAVIPAWRHVGVDAATLGRVHDGTIDDPTLAALLPAGVTTADVRAFVANAYDEVTGLLVLQQQPDASGCDFSGFRLQHNDPAAGVDNSVTPVDLVRIARFIRLWRALGWTMPQTDAVIGALFPNLPPAGPPPGARDFAGLDAGFAVLILRLGVVLDVMRRLKVHTADLESLLTLWAPMASPTTGSLYEQVFLSPTLLALDPSFAPDATGAVLGDAGARVDQHLDALRAANGLTAAELQLVVATLPAGGATPLDLAVVGHVYACAWLARRLRLSVAELLGVLRHSGLDPFAGPEPPTPGITGLLDLLDDLVLLRLKPTQALYLMYDDDLTGTSSTASDDAARLARTLRASFVEVDAQFAVVDDPTGEIARARMSLAYSEEATLYFFGLLAGSLTVSTGYAHDHEALDPLVLAASDDRLRYDDLGKTLTFAGLLTLDVRAAIAAVAGIRPELLAAVDVLATDSQARTAAFFARYPELAAPYDAFVLSTDSLQHRLRTVLDTILPDLVRRRRQQQALAALAAVLQVGTDVVAAVADDPAVLRGDAGSEGTSALDDLTAIADGGLDMRVWNQPALGPGDPDQEGLAAQIDTDQQALPHPGPVSVTWAGSVEAPSSGTFAFAVDTDGAVARLRIDGRELALDEDGQRWRTHDPVPLEAGALAAVEVEVEGIGNRVTLRWQTAGLGWQPVPSKNLYPRSAMERLAHSLTRVRKVASLALAAKLTSAETTHLATDPGLQVGALSWPNALRVGSAIVTGHDVPLTAVLRAVAWYAGAKARWSPTDERLLAILGAPGQLGVAGAASPLSQLMGWSDEIVDSLLTRTGHARADLASLAVLRRLSEAAAVVAVLGTTAGAAIATATNDPTIDQVATFQTAVRARFAEEDWRQAVKPIIDDLRKLQRDALIAYVLRRLSETPATAHLDTPDKLFEFFLMDVEMDPCTLTSRIRHALSSVQLFVERCLMNLEPEVSPGSIDAVQWAWMKRYRVWEAARKVFLWPENWLEPELRDDQSPIFKQVVGELLQGDVTADRAAAALTSYLTQLEEVAHLEPCGMYVDEQDAGTADDVVHVIGRTSGAHRKYFYRRREYGFWTPWEPVKLDIEDNPVVPVVWKGRLFVFWLRLIRSTPTDPSTVSTTAPAGKLADVELGTVKSTAAAGLNASAAVHVKAVLSYSEYVAGAWTPVKTSDPEAATDLGSFKADGAGSFSRMSLRLSTSGEDGTLQVSANGSGGSWFQIYSSSAAPVRREDAVTSGIFTVIWGFPASRSLTVSGGTLSATYNKSGWAFVTHSLFEDPLQRTVVVGKTPIRAVAPAQSSTAPWDLPFLVSDAEHAFYVETSEEPTHVREFAGYGYAGSPTTPTTPPVIPPIYWEETPSFKPRVDPWERLVNPAATVTDPALLRLGLSEDVHITKAVGALGAVRFGERQIGPSGTIADRTVLGGP